MTEEFIAHGRKYKLKFFVGEACDGGAVVSASALIRRIVGEFKNAPVSGIVEVNGVVVKISHE